MPEDNNNQDLTPDSNRFVKRRDFLRNATVGAAAATVNSWAGAAPLQAEALRDSKGPIAKSTIETGKDIPAQWWDSLFARGRPAVYRGEDPRFIGMLVSGITTGQVYLGADGTLWHWDIFNQALASDFSHYVFPLWAISNVEQGFEIRIDGEEPRRLAKGGFPQITFRGEYPIGFVEYRDSQYPLEVSLEAFSPFTPLQVDDSSLPATIMRISVRNKSASPVTGELMGTLENTVAGSAEIFQPVKRLNRIIRQDRFLLLNCESDVDPGGRLRDAGTMGLALLSATQDDRGVAQIDRADEKLVGSIARKLALAPGESHTAAFAIVWCFPNLSIKGLKTPGGRHYATRFNSASAVASYLAANFDRLCGQTKSWHDVWYDSTLPHWLLQRTLLNVSTLATSTSLRFSDGRFYGNEGVIDTAVGTCTHVWHYEQAMGRLFPELDILLRERADFNPEISFKRDGLIDSRGEFNAGAAVDGQAGTILRALRDHQTSSDGNFLKRNWPAIKKATQWLIDQDGDADGILEGTQHNTLDAAWYGAVAWLSGLYLAALRAAEEMARDSGDAPFAERCRQIFEVGQKNFVRRLFNGEYFVNQPDPRHPQSINSGNGCEIDQVLGQSWAFQVALGRILPEAETRSALAALWRHNFLTDIGPYRASNKPGRWFALPGDAGLLMCAFPRLGGDSIKAKEAHSPYETGYFNECMTGFEHQVAAHMIWEGMVKEGLAVERAIHDRYDTPLRNPWNEVEYGDHYARAMASYGVFIAACGFEYHGPKGYIAFSPKLTPENFRSAFTASQGWGRFHQTIGKGGIIAAIELRWGTLRLKTVALTCTGGLRPAKVSVLVEGKVVPAHLTFVGTRAEINLSTEVSLKEDQQLVVTLS